jgi:hypothetical protein
MNNGGLKNIRHGSFMNLSNLRTLIINLLTFLSISISTVSCNPDKAFNEVAVTDPDGAQKDIPEFILGVPFDPSGVTNCEQFFQDDEAEGICVVFNDSFERDGVTGSSSLGWDKLIMDSGNIFENVDAKIENSAHLGDVIDGDKALLFSGREGGSTHEVYLISRPIDFSQYRYVYIQFRYVPLSLEESINMTFSGQTLPESIRVDVCSDTDQSCGLDNTMSASSRRSALYSSSWVQNFLDVNEFGDHLNIRNYVRADWKLGQIIIDLADYPGRASQFVFRITAAMDEGYDGNNRNNVMDDGIILDDVIVLGVVELGL